MVIANDTDYDNLHRIFGNSWEVTSRNDWLFSDSRMNDLIHYDIQKGSPFTPSYDIVFDSEEERIAAEIVSLFNHSLDMKSSSD